MNVFIVHAHPEAESLNGSLLRFMVEHLKQAGHAVEISNLYTMKWKPELEPGSIESFLDGTQAADITEEQRKLRWADTVIFQFPLWWYSMPAILKGWVDRVYAKGFAYGVGEHSDRRWGTRFGEGVMAGKRAMLVVTAGGWESHYGPRGINGPMEDLLFPIHHGVLHYPGFDVLPPFVVYRTSKVDQASYPGLTRALGARLESLSTTAPIAFRKQNFGDYEIPSMTLRDDLEPNRSGFAVHVSRD